MAWASHSVAFYGLDLSRIGSVLLAQLRESELTRLFSIFNVTDELKVLEGLLAPGATPDASPFNHPPSIGLHKKHFTDPRFLVQNLSNFASSKKPKAKEHRRKTWNKAVASSQAGTVDHAFAGAYVHATVIDAFQEKVESRSMTGEWVVFKKQTQGNFYFTLAGHKETNEAIYERVALCAQSDGIAL